MREQQLHRLALVLFWLRICVLVLVTMPLAAADCPPMGKEAIDRLAEYIHKRFRFPSTISLELESVEPVASSCFRKARFRSKDSESNVSATVEFFVSPDGRFIFRELMDTSIDPVDSFRRQYQISLEQLTSGPYPIRGAKSPVTITIFSDFQCPYCKQAVELLHRVSMASPETVKLVFRNLPSPQHDWARTAAEMAACAFKQSNEAFWDVHDFLFKRQSDVTVGNIASMIYSFISKDPNIDQQVYRACVDGHLPAAQIEEDLAFAKSHGIRATPTIFVNDRRIEGVGNPEELLALVQGFAAEAATKRQ